jgi:hypothetical protein
MPPKKFWYVGAMPAANGRVHPDVFQSVQHLAEGKPYGGYVAVFGPYSSKAEANVAAAASAAKSNPRRRRNPIDLGGINLDSDTYVDDFSGEEVETVDALFDRIQDALRAVRGLKIVSGSGSLSDAYNEVDVTFEVRYSGALAFDALEAAIVAALALPKGDTVAVEEDPLGDGFVVTLRLSKRTYR